MFGFPSQREVIAGLRDQVIELGTVVRFLEADRPSPQPQPRDDAGRFVSKRVRVAEQLKAYVDATTPEQRARDTEKAIAELRAKALQGARR